MKKYIKNENLLKKNKQTGIIHVLSTRNNTILTLTDAEGNIKYSLSGGKIGFKNSRKATTYAAQTATEKIISESLKFGFFSIIIRMKGLGRGKKKSVKSICKSSLNILKIEERTPLPHNGCRFTRKRRT